MSEQPKRTQLSRKKGSRMLPDARKVDRTTAFGNPFKPQPIRANGGRFRAGGRAALRRRRALQCIEMFRSELTKAIAGKPLAAATRDHFEKMASRIHELSGKTLACWCRLCPEHAAGKRAGEFCTDCDPCHSDVLLELSNPR